MKYLIIFVFDFSKIIVYICSIVYDNNAKQFLFTKM